MNIEEQVYKVVCRYIGVGLEEVSMEKKIVEDLGADSLDMMELCMAVEEEFEIDTITDEVWDTVKTVADIVHIVARKDL